MFADVVVSLVGGALAGHLTVRLHYWRQRRRMFRVAETPWHVRFNAHRDAIPGHPALRGHAVQNAQALDAINRRDR